MDSVGIFDTTLRDGEQSPGFSMNVEEKLRLARQLEQLGVDIIEAGFPIASRGDLEAVRSVAREVRACRIAALARTCQSDVDAAVEALEPAAQPRLHIFLATSDLHLRHKLNLSRAQALEAISAMVRCGRRHVAEVEFSAEDASRSDPKFLCKACDAAFRAGATILNLPDTVGYAVPEEYAAMFSAVREYLGDPPGVTFSEAQVVVAMGAEGDSRRVAEILAHGAEHRGVLLRNGVAHRVGQIEDCGAGAKCGIARLAKKFGIAAAGIFGGKLHFGDAPAPAAYHRGNSLEGLRARQIQLVAQVQIGSRQENMQARLGGGLQRFDGSVHITLARAGERGNAAGADFAGHTADSFKLAARGNREAGLDDVHAKLFELAGQPELFLDVHGEARRLLAVTQGGVKNTDAVHRFPQR